MARPRLEEVDKLKDRVIALSDEEADVLFTWFEMLLEVREADKKRAQKKLEAAKGESSNG